MKRINVKIFGVFPTVYSMCAPCCTHDYLAVCKESYSNEQILEYPKWVRDQQDEMVLFIQRLAKFGRFIKVEVVSVDSLKGLYYALRYRLKPEFAVIVEGKVFRGDIDFGDVEKYILELIEKRFGAKIKLTTPVK